MGFLKSLAQNVVGASPYALRALQQNQAEGDAQDETLRSNFFKGQANDRANAQETSEEALRDAQVKNLGNDTEWENPVAATGSDGQPILVQRNKRTGDLRPAVIGGPSAPLAPSMPGVQVTSDRPASNVNVGAISTPPPVAAPTPSEGAPPAGMSLAGKPSLASKIPKQQPVAPAAQTTTTPLSANTGGPQPLRPYVKPPVAAIPYNLTPAGMQADSTLAAKKAQAEAPHKKDPNAAPTPTYTPVTVTNPDGSVTVKPFNTKTGTTGESIGGPKPAAAAGGSASLSPEARDQMMAQARLDNQTMKDYEAKVLAGTAKVGTALGVAGALSDGSQGVAGKVSGVLGNAATGAVDPEYQKYLTAQRSYGRIMGNLQSKRYTDHQAEIERSISGLQGNDLPGTIQYKQQMRDVSLADVTPSASGGGRGGSPGGTPAKDPGGNITLGGGAVTPAERAALKAQGFTDAQINAIKP